MARSALPILAFPSAEAKNAWLAAQPADAPGLWLKFAKKSAGAPSVTKPEAIERALAHGWIDGQLAPFDADWFLTRFTPRKAKRRWSEINRKTAERLIAEGRMASRGLAEVEKARAEGRWDQAYPSASLIEVPDDLKAALDAEPAAKALFERLDATNRYAVLYRTHNMKTPAGLAKKIADFVAMLARGETPYPLKDKG